MILSFNGSNKMRKERPHWHSTNGSNIEQEREEAVSSSTFRCIAFCALHIDKCSHIDDPARATHRATQCDVWHDVWFSAVSFWSDFPRIGFFAVGLLAFTRQSGLFSSHRHPDLFRWSVLEVCRPWRTSDVLLPHEHLRPRCILCVPGA